MSQASSGSLFLDEISEMPLSMQVKLLRVLQEREVTRVGGEAVIPVDVRVIAATNRDLLHLIEENHFREDLFYRLNVINLLVPPLRERQEDIPLLGQSFLERFAEKNRKHIKGFTPEAMDLMVKHAWLGNVRELMNTVERGVVLARGEFLEAADMQLRDAAGAPPCGPHPTASHGLPLEQVEKMVILQTLQATGGNKSETARQLSITRKTLHNKLKKYGLMKPSGAK